MERRLVLRHGAPLAAALVLGGGAGAGVYAGLSSSSTPSSTTTAAAVAAQPVAAKATSTSLTQLYDDAAPGVVDITVTGAAAPSPYPGGGGGGSSSAEGSGFVIDTSGNIVTNQHVVAGSTSVKVRFANGQTAKATVVGTDPSTDIAVIKVNVPASQLHPLTLGSSAGVQVGQQVAAIGSPFGLTGTMTAGIVSAVDRTIQAPNNYSIAGAIQTDAPINHGNSGGPLLDLSGRVIGVNAQIESNSGDNAGVGFAVPIDSVKSVARTLIAGGTVQHAYLGIRISNVASGAGAQVGSVTAGSPAEKAGLKPGDVITAIDGKAIQSADDLTAVVNSHSPNDSVTVTITRSGSSQTLTVKLGVRPS